jgi:preprotein translocase subunit SecG
MHRALVLENTTEAHGGVPSAALFSLVLAGPPRLTVWPPSPYTEKVAGLRSWRVSADEANRMIYWLLVGIHVLVCIFLVIVVLLQSGKAADLAGAFGGMGSQTAFGPRGSATILSKATTIAAGLFMITSMTLAIMASRGTTALGSTVLDNSPVRTQSAPAQSRPGPLAPAPAGAPKVGGGVVGGGSTAPVPIPPRPPAQQQPAPAKK